MTQQVSDKVLGKFARQQADWFRRVREGSLDPKAVSEAIQKLINPNQFLHRLYADEEIMIGATTGEETIADASDLFPGFLDSDFKNWETNKPSGVTTKPVLATVFEMYQKNGTFRQIFGSLGNIDDLCWEQGQILNFVREHSNKLHPKGWATFLPFKVKGVEESFVVCVRRDADELRADVRRFGRDNVWAVENRSRVVVPQLS